MNHIGLSGAGFAIPGIAGASYQLLKNGFKPDIISGVSSGAILTFLYTFSDNPDYIIENNITNFKSNDVFNTPPINKRGKFNFRLIWNLITKNYLTKQDNLKKTLMELVPEDVFYSKRDNLQTPIALTLSVDILTGSRVVHRLNDMSYSNAISAVVASTSIPIFTKPVRMKKNLLVDGGIRNHILSEWVFDNYDIKISYNIFSRPKDFNKNIKENKISNLFTILIRTIEIMQFEISKTDQDLADFKARKQGIKNFNIFIPRILDNVYEENQGKQKLLFEIGKKVVSEINPL